MSTERQHGEGTYQMLWDCKFCGTEKLLGVTHRHCPNCGAPQDPEERYLPAEADMVRLENHKFVGADVICPACRQPNSAASAFCGECGADLATGEKVQEQAGRDVGEGGAAGTTKRDVVKDQFDAEMRRIGVTGPGGFLGLKRREWTVVGVIGFVVACIVAAVFAFTYRQDAKGYVEDRRWEYAVEIESLQSVGDGDWRDSVPSGAYSRRCYERQRSTRQVDTGRETCRDVPQGDGSFRRECEPVYRDEPVMDTWCDYKIDRWRSARDVKAEGSYNASPHWPQYTLSQGSGLRGLGEERVKERTERYIVYVRESDADQHDCDFDDRAKWESFGIESSVEFKVGLGGNIDCKSLKLAAQ